MNWKLIFAAAAMACLFAGCSSSPKKETAAPAPVAAKPACSNDGDCASAGPCGKCVGGSCKPVFGPDCCDRDSDCGNPALRCRANHCK